MLGYWLGFTIYYKLLEYLFEMYRMAALDEFFHLDNEKNRANIIVVTKTDKVKDYEKLRSRIIELALKNHRARHCLTAGINRKKTAGY